MQFIIVYYLFGFIKYLNNNIIYVDNNIVKRFNINKEMYNEKSK